jgi:CRISPR-associated protein Csx17
MPDIELRGCRTLPLLSYLKTLGVLKHVANAEPDARLWWHPEGFAELRSLLDEGSLVDFFLDEYVPTPITSPWNGGSGYYPSTNVPALEVLEGAGGRRFAAFANTIKTARELIDALDIGDGIERSKEELLYRWRADAPEPTLDWLDAVAVLGESKVDMNPLLGTGGNDGRFDFSGNFVQHLVTCLGHALGGSPKHRDRSEEMLRGALFDLPVKLESAAVGMFDPSSAGLPNSSSSPTETSLVNPWDFVLLLEGATLFGGGVARRLHSDGAVFPFTVRRVGSIGTSLDVGADGSSRGETWLPIWSRPARLPSVKRLMQEGRTQDGRRQSTSGRDLLRAVKDIGVDRGVDRFERVVYAPRFGRNYVAVPVGPVDVLTAAGAPLLRSADRWLERVRRNATPGLNHGVALIDRTAAEVLCGVDQTAALRRWLLALADVELVLSRRPAARAVAEPTHIPPLSGLDRRIAMSAPNGTEHRLALALAAVGRRPGEFGLRQLVEPVYTTDFGRFDWSTDGAVGPSLDHPLDLLIALVKHPRVDLSSVPGESRARLDDVAAFLAGATNDESLARLAFALTLCVPCSQPRRTAPRAPGAVDRLYALVRLVTADNVAQRPGGQALEVRRAPEAVAALAAGNASRAARAAVRRLRADGLAPFASLETLDRDATTCRRIAAALAFPLHPDDRVLLERGTLTPVEHSLTI